MESMSTPGVYFQSLQPLPVEADLLRSDICAFVGYTEKGPTSLPVRIESWRQFLALFGQPLTLSHLAYAVKGFFENGGATCYVLRIVDDNALASNALLLANNDQLLWQVHASFRVSDITASEAIESAVPDTAIVQNISADTLRAPLENPGGWGNDISMSVERSSRLSTHTNGIFDEGFSSALNSLVGLDEHSVVVLSQEQQQEDGTKKRIARIIEIESIEPLRQRVNWKESLLLGLEPFESDEPVCVDTVEFDVSVFFENRQVEKFTWLGIHPQHPNSIHQVLSQQSQYINLVFLGEDDTDWFQIKDNSWPQNKTQKLLQQGADGVSQIAAKHYLAAIEIIAQVDEVSVLAAPDLVLSSEILDIPVTSITPRVLDCKSLTAPGVGVIYGQVSDGINNLFNVTVTDAESGQQVTTDKLGKFQLVNLDISLRTLRFEKSGFSKEERQVFSGKKIPDTAEQFSLQALTVPRSLTELEILEVQRAMANPFLLGQYRVALLDPPDKELKTEDIRNWRAKVGDSAFVGIFYPWIETPSLLKGDDDLHHVPPCGHIAGLMARKDIEQGPHRAPANIKLRFAKALSQSVNDTQHGILNAEGINAIRSLSGQGIRLYGARTLSSDAQWRYLSVRRFVLALEKTLEFSMQWAVFESNNTILRQSVLFSIRALLNNLWRIGGLAGKTPEAAFRIKCDDDNNPQAQRDRGQFLVEIGIAPSVPFEFIRIRFGRTLDAIEVTE